MKRWGEMESTTCGKDCAFAKQGFCNDDSQCPNYMETFWQDGKSGEIKKLKDCAPKRLLLNQMALQSRFEIVQQALEQSRNEYSQLSLHLKTLMEMSKTVIQQQLKNEVSNEKAISFQPNDADILH